MGHRGATLAARSRGPDRLTGVWLALSALLLGAGLFLPAVTFGRLFFSEEHSLAGAVFGFAASGNWFLFLLTFTFSIAFPLGKVAACLALWFAVPPGARWAPRLAEWLGTLSRWSMADVFVIALVVLAVDGRILDSADIHVGVPAFAAGVLLSAWAARRVGVMAAAANGDGAPAQGCDPPADRQDR